MSVKKLSIMHYYIAKKKSKNWMSFLYITCNTELFFFFFRKLVQSKNGHSHPAPYLLTVTAVLEEKNPEDLFDASWTGAFIFFSWLFCNDLQRSSSTSILNS